MSREVISYCDGDHSRKVAAELTRKFTLDGIYWETDLCVECMVTVDEAVGTILKHGRKAFPPRRQASRTSASRAHDAAIRAWWNRHPEVSSVPFQARGRLPGEVRSAYGTAHRS